MNSGRWVWVEFPEPCKRDELPDSYYSLAGAAVYCRLFARGVRDELLDWIAANPHVKPPEKLRKEKLEAWIEAEMDKEDQPATWNLQPATLLHSRIGEQTGLEPAVPGVWDLQ